MPSPIASMLCLVLAVAGLAGGEAAPGVPIPIRIDHRGLLTIDGVLRANSEGGWGASNLVVKPIGGFAAQDYSLAGIVRDGARTTAEFATTPRLRMVEVAEQAKDAQGRACMRVAYELTPLQGAAANFEAVYVQLPLAAADAAGGSVSLSEGRRVTLPQQPAGEQIIAPGERSVELAWGKLRLRVASETLRIGIVDLRPKTSAFHIRLVHPAPTGAAPLRFSFDIAAEGEPHVVRADGSTWVELPAAGPPVPGGILDFSGLGGGPAGEEGRIAVRDGRFVLSGSGRRIRLVGGNLCYTANYLDQPVADRLAARFRAMGWNAVRFHHTDVHIRRGDWSSQSSDDIDPERLDRLDYLFAAMKKAGLYVTIDLYTQRRFGKGEIAGVDQAVEGDIKALVPIHEPAFAAWKKLVVKWMEHVNPYTGLAWKDDPALFSVCPLNEDSIASVWGGGPAKAMYLDRFAQWKRELGLESKTDRPGDDPLFARFLTEVKMASNRRIEAFLRELGVKAMLSGDNWWDTMAQTFTRDQLDVVDNHQYSDHPQPHWLPSRYNQQGNLTGHPTYMTPVFMASTRILGKPFTVSEWNYCAPNRFRAEGGALMGAYAALQDWDGLFRFAWAHDAKLVDGDQPLRGFDIATDPLNQLAERQVVLLFRRGDVAVARRSYVYGVTMADAVRQGVGDMWSKGIFPHRFNALALLSRTGSQVIEGDRRIAGSYDGVVAAERPSDAALAGNPFLALADTPAVGDQAASDTGEITLDRKAGILRVATPASACIVGPGGRELEAGALALAGGDGFASVSLHAMDGRPIADSGRLLLLHLTDVLNQDMAFASPERTTLLSWGGPQRLVRTGSAAVRVRCATAGLRVFACDPAGARLHPVEATHADGVYAFRIAVTRESPCMVYELARE